MLIKVKDKTIEVDPLWTGTSVGYQMGYLSAAQKHELGLLRTGVYAIRIDGSRASLCKVINGYTSEQAPAEIVTITPNN